MIGAFLLWALSWLAMGLLAGLWVYVGILLVCECWAAGERHVLILGGTLIWPVMAVIFLTFDALSWAWSKTVSSGDPL